MKQKKIPLSLQIFLALGLGIAVGMAFTGNPTFAVSYIKPFGTIFLNLLKFPSSFSPFSPASSP